MLAERGISVDHTTIYRWVQCYAPEMERSGCAGSGGVALIRAGAWMKPTSRCGASGPTCTGQVDKRGDTIDFYLSPTRSAKAAKRFLGKRPARPEATGKSLPRSIPTKRRAMVQRITELKREGKLDRETAHRQVKYLNNDRGRSRKAQDTDQAGARFQIDPYGLAPRSGDSKSVRALRRMRLALCACSPASGARCALWRELLALGPRR